MLEGENRTTVDEWRADSGRGAGTDRILPVELSGLFGLAVYFGRAGAFDPVFNAVIRAADVVGISEEKDCSSGMGCVRHRLSRYGPGFHTRCQDRWREC